MIKAFVFDSARVLIHPISENVPSLNTLYGQVTEQNRNFHEFFRLNTELLDFLKEIKPDFDLYIFTSGDLIQEAPEVKTAYEEIFIEIIETSKFGYDKSSSQAFVSLTEYLELKPAEIFFTDDKLDNVRAASSAGLETMHYTDPGTLISAIKHQIP